jgi:hypothetical protein
VTTFDYIALATQAIVALGACAAFAQSLRNGVKIREVHLTMNSRLDELIRSTKALAYSEGAAAAHAEATRDAAAVVARAADAAATILDRAKPQ